MAITTGKARDLLTGGMWTFYTEDAVWSYDPKTGIVEVTVGAAGTYSYEVGVVGGGVYLRRR